MQFSADSKCQDGHIYRKTKYTKQGWNTGNDNPTDVKEQAAASAIGKKNISHYSTELLTKDTPANSLLAQAISSVPVKISAFPHKCRECLSWDTKIPQLPWPLLKSIKISQEITMEHLSFSQYSDKKLSQKSARALGFSAPAQWSQLHSQLQELSVLGYVTEDAGSQMELSVKTLVHLFQAGTPHPLPTPSYLDTNVYNPTQSL